MAALSLLVPLLLLLLPPVRPEGPGCRLRWVQVGPGAGGCRGGSAGACVGHCESSAVPSPHGAPRPLSARAQCCAMAAVRRVRVTLQCPGGPRRLRTLSAASCRCDACTFARY
ncbi:glycoprotein hormone alpha-2 [Cuculus canorus]|uniref:glycoprotein hormone alpha-2 n=1 Tax=Cuculus canorus TaxID=55661 RepID=UPI0023AAC4B4|nr:glycoprotein hormone alpha-2 [Cuculus canorus]